MLQPGRVPTACMVDEPWASPPHGMFLFPQRRPTPATPASLHRRPIVEALESRARAYCTRRLHLPLDPRDRPSALTPVVCRPPSVVQQSVHHTRLAGSAIRFRWALV